MNILPIPQLLEEIPDAPKQLYYVGNFPDENKYKFLAVVGSRKFTSYGKQVCEHLIRGLAGHPIVIVSGLSLGVDSIAHAAALENNLITVAVPGSGLDPKVLYPASNRALAQKILDARGALVSEFEPDFKATNWSFPKRNRIMAGMAHAVLVIEAEEKSGTRITARLATEYNRDVLTVPGSIFSSASDGTNALLYEGATPVRNAHDIIEALGLDPQVNNSKQESLFEHLTEDEQRVLNFIDEPKSRNMINEHLGTTIMQTNILLSSMEIKGLIKESLGKIMRIR
tara:strand:- start:8705 stop:9556 length:852 start_codon:yes stop_codon:yes gene_type:complete